MKFESKDGLRFRAVNRLVVLWHELFLASHTNGVQSVMALIPRLARPTTVCGKQINVYRGRSNRETRSEPDGTACSRTD